MPRAELETGLLPLVSLFCESAATSFSKSGVSLLVRRRGWCPVINIFLQFAA